jgi:hypothetical protein
VPLAAGLAGAGLAAYGLYQMNEDSNARTGTTLGERITAGLAFDGGAAENRMGDEIEARRQRQREANERRSLSPGALQALGVDGADGGVDGAGTLGSGRSEAAQSRELAGAIRLLVGQLQRPITANVDAHTAAHAAGQRASAGTPAAPRFNLFE